MYQGGEFWAVQEAFCKQSFLSVTATDRTKDIGRGKAVETPPRGSWSEISPFLSHFIILRGFVTSQRVLRKGGC